MIILATELGTKSWPACSELRNLGNWPDHKIELLSIGIKFEIGFLNICMNEAQLMKYEKGVAYTGSNRVKRGAWPSGKVDLKDILNLFL